MAVSPFIRDGHWRTSSKDITSSEEIPMTPGEALAHFERRLREERDSLRTQLVIPPWKDTNPNGGTSMHLQLGKIEGIEFALLLLEHVQIILDSSPRD